MAITAAVVVAADILVTPVPLTIIMFVPEAHKLAAESEHAVLLTSDKLFCAKVAVVAGGMEEPALEEALQIVV